MGAILEMLTRGVEQLLGRAKAQEKGGYFQE